MVSIPLGEGVAMPVWVLGPPAAVLSLIPGDSSFPFFQELSVVTCLVLSAWCGNDLKDILEPPVLLHAVKVR